MRHDVAEADLKVTMWGRQQAECLSRPRSGGVRSSGEGAEQASEMRAENRRLPPASCGGCDVARTWLVCGGRTCCPVSEQLLTKLLAFHICKTPVSRPSRPYGAIRVRA